MRRNISDLLTHLRPEWVLLILIAVAAALRFWRLDVLPPGLFYDEAYNGLDANRVFTGAYRPVFFVGNNGREPLYIYMQALSIGLFGATPLALRLTSAVIGIATIPIIYFAARVILPATERSDASPLLDSKLIPWLALIAAAGVVVSYWHLSLSRLGFRTVLLIPVSALAIAFFWRAWTRGQLRDYLWSGLWFGIALYTYTAARLLPLVVAVFLLVELAANLINKRGDARQIRALWQPRLKGLVLMAVVGSLIALPLLWVITQEPDLFSARTRDVNVLSKSGQETVATTLERLADNSVAVIRNFYHRGDQNVRHNLPGRPVNDPWLAILFTLGWVSALWRVRLARNRLLLIWLLVMLMPTVLSTDAPHALRSTGALPAIAMFYALGGEAICIGWIHLRKRWRAAGWPASARPEEFRSTASSVSAAPLLAVLLFMLIVSGGLTVNDYFRRWATLPALGNAFETDLQIAAHETARLLAGGSSGQAVLLSGSLFSQPQLRFALGQPVSMDPPADSSLLSSPDPTQTRFIFDHNFDPRRPLVLLWREGEAVRGTWTAPLLLPVDEAIRQEEDNYVYARPIDWPNHQLGWPVAFTGFLPREAQFCPQLAPIALPIDFANGVRLVGYGIDTESHPAGHGNDVVRLTLYWQQQMEMDGRYGLPEEQATLRDFEVSVHLMSNGDVLQIQDGPIATSNTRDRPYVGGRVVQDERLFSVPSSSLLESPHFEIGLFESSEGQSLLGGAIIPVIGADSSSLSADGHVLIAWDEAAQGQSSNDGGCHVLAGQWRFPITAWVSEATALLQEQRKSVMTGVRYRLDIRFQNGLHLIAYDLYPDWVDPSSGERKIRLKLFWQADAAAPPLVSSTQLANWWSAREFDIFVHLVDGTAVWQTANRPFAERQLLAQGGVVESAHEFVVSQDMPLGKAHFEAGLYFFSGLDSAATGGERIPIVDQQGRAAGDMTTLGGVLIGQQVPPLKDQSLSLMATFQDYIELSDVHVVERADVGQIDVTLHWRAEDRPSGDYTAFVHLTDRENNIVSQYDQPPGGVGNPTHLWAPNEVVQGTFPLQLPAGYAADELTLRIGLYELLTGNRLPLRSLGNSQIKALDGTYLEVPLAVMP